MDKKWVNLRTASKELNLPARDLKRLIRQKKWKVDRIKVNNRKSLYILKADINSHKKSTNSSISVPRLPEKKELVTSEMLFRFLDTYEEKFYQYQTREFNLHKRASLFKTSLIWSVIICLIVVGFFSYTNFILVRSDSHNQKSIRSLEAQIVELNSTLKDASRELSESKRQGLDSEIKHSEQIKAIYDQFTTDKDKKLFEQRGREEAR